MDDKQLLIEKYHLKYENNAWYSEKENTHKHLIFKDAFVERTDVIGLLFRINKLCMAKVKYFRANIDKFEPLKYHYKNGFVSVSLWDADFLRHRASGYILDFRYLQTIITNRIIGIAVNMGTRTGFALPLINELKPVSIVYGGKMHKNLARLEI